jgi:hypothetical protein
MQSPPTLSFSTDTTALPARLQGAIHEVLAASMAPMRLSISSCSRDLGRQRLAGVVADIDG